MYLDYGSVLWICLTSGSFSFLFDQLERQGSLICLPLLKWIYICLSMYTEPVFVDGFTDMFWKREEGFSFQFWKCLHPLGQVVLAPFLSLPRYHAAFLWLLSPHLAAQSAIAVLSWLTTVIQHSFNLILFPDIIPAPQS